MISVQQETKDVIKEYRHVLRAKLLSRVNRFTVSVQLDKSYSQIRCHLHDPGRLVQLIIPNAEVLLRCVKRKSLAKTSCDVLAIKTDTGIYAIADSRIPNTVFKWLVSRGYLGEIIDLREEYSVMDSRFDFLLVREHEYIVVEVKGCNLVRNGICYFPDSPSKRASKHLTGLMNLCRSGYRTAIVFIAMRSDARAVSSNRAIDPEFSSKLKQAVKAGVACLAFKVGLEVHGDTAIIRYLGQLPVIV
jgi:sugar fermentation stimulation protein A